MKYGTTLQRLMTLAAMTALLCAGAAVQAASVTWDGGGDGTSWNDPINWSNNAFPSQTNDTLNITRALGTDVVTNVYRTTGTATYDGGSTYRGNVNLNRGTITMNAHFGSGSNGIFNIGDGTLTGGLPDSTVNVSNAGWRFDRHSNGTYTVNIKQDGLLAGGTYLNYGGHGGRKWVINIDGGSMTSPNAWNMSDGAGYDANRVNLSLGGTVNVGAITVHEEIIDFADSNAGNSFTANYGGSFANIAAVTAALGSTFTATGGAMLDATDNLDGTFTVAAVKVLNSKTTGQWHLDTTWDGGTGVIPTASDKAAISTLDTVTVSAGHPGSASAVDIAANGALQINDTLTVGGTVDVPSGATLNAPGTINAATINTAGTTSLTGGGNVGAVNVTAAGATLHYGSTATTNLVVTDGAVAVGPGAAVTNADFTAGAGTVNTGANALGIRSEMKLPDGITATFTPDGGATSFGVSGANIIDNSAARTFILSGGTVTLSSPALPGDFVPLANIAATAENNHYGVITNTTAWVGMDRGSQAAPDKAALQNNVYQNKWTPSKANYWGKWHLDSTASNTSFDLAELFWWQYDQSGYNNRGIPTAKLYYSNSTSDPGNPKANLANWTLFYDNTAGTGLPAWPLTTGQNNDHTVVELPVDFAARWIAILPTTPSPQDGNGIGTILFSQPGAGGAINLSNTNIEVMHNSTLSLDTTGDVTLGDLIFNLDGHAPNDILLTLDSGASSISFDELILNGLALPGTYVLLDWNDAPGFTNTFSGIQLNGVGTVETLGNTLVLTATSVIPEPMTMIALGMGIAGIGGYIRKRRRA